MILYHVMIKGKQNTHTRIQVYLLKQMRITYMILSEDFIRSRFFYTIYEYLLV